ncbi:unnamed protein product [Gadus morhua 'NCC']
MCITRLSCRPLASMETTALKSDRLLVRSSAPISLYSFNMKDLVAWNTRPLLKTDAPRRDAGVEVVFISAVCCHHVVSEFTNAHASITVDTTVHERGSMSLLLSLFLSLSSVLSLLSPLSSL